MHYLPCIIVVSFSANCIALRPRALEYILYLMKLSYIVFKFSPFNFKLFFSVTEQHESMSINIVVIEMKVAKMKFSLYFVGNVCTQTF